MRLSASATSMCSKFRRIGLFIAVALILVFLLNNLGFLHRLPSPSVPLPPMPRVVTPRRKPNDVEEIPAFRPPPAAADELDPSELHVDSRLDSPPLKKGFRPSRDAEFQKPVPKQAHDLPQPRHSLPAHDPSVPFSLETFDPRHVPENLQFKHYNKKKIYEPELEASVDPRIIHGCRFCAYPSYPRNFKNRGFADAFINHHGDQVVVLANLNLGGSYEVELEPIGMFSEDFHPIRFSCEHPLRDSWNMKIMCNIPEEHKRSILVPHDEERERLIQSGEFREVPCYRLQLILDGRESCLSQPVLLRHCYVPRSDMLDVSEIPSPPHKLGLCGMSENRARFWVEWLEYHLMMGVAHVYLYMHPGGYHYYDEGIEVMSDYVERNQVTIFMWNYTIPIFSRGTRHNKDQSAAQADCINRFQDFYEWILMTDDDEFPVPLEHETVVEFLDEKYGTQKDLGACVVNSWWYTNERSTMDTHLTTKMYEGLEKVVNEYHKSIIRPNNVHLFAIHDITLGGAKSWVNDKKEMYLAHYFYRKWHDYNPIVDKKEEEDFQHTPLEKLIPELERRVAAAEERIDFDRFDFDYYFKLLTDKEKAKLGITEEGPVPLEDAEKYMKK